jgi:hypothetical protein
MKATSIQSLVSIRFNNENTKQTIVPCRVLLNGIED